MHLGDCKECELALLISNSYGKFIQFLQAISYLMLPSLFSRIVTYAVPWPIMQLLPQLIPSCPQVALEQAVLAPLANELVIIGDNLILDEPAYQQYFANCSALVSLDALDNHFAHLIYLPLPCHPQNLRQTLLRARFAGQRAERVQLSVDLEFHPTLRRLLGVSGEQLLTVKEAELLWLLYLHRGNKLSHGEIITTIWGYKANIPTNTLPTHIHRLRQKLGKDAAILHSEAGYYWLEVAVGLQELR